MSDSFHEPEWFREGIRHIWLPYTQMQNSPLPQAVKAVQGSRIILEDGRELIDGVASWWTACHGYNHPHIKEAVATQLDKMPHVMLAGLSNEPAFTLATRLAALTPGDLNRVFISESGSVSVEIALKLAVQYWFNRGRPERQKIIAFKNGYHGDTIGTMAIGDSENIMHSPFAGLMHHQQILDIPADEKTRQDVELFLEYNAGECAAVVLEPLVQGAGGMIFHDTETVKFINDTCKKHDLLLILDEIMVGFGRLGSMFACQQADVVPDILTLSKSLTGGTMALAATVASDRIFEAFLSDDIEDCFMHGPTYTGNALACAAANASLDLFETEPRLEQVQNIAAKLKAELVPCRSIKGVVDVRTMGALGVVELDDMGDVDDMYWIRKKFVEEGCWVRPFGNIVYLMPPFVISDEELSTLTDTVVKIVGEWSDRKPS